MKTMNLMDFSTAMIEKAKKAGAEIVEVSVSNSSSSNVSVRKGELEQLGRSESRGFVVRAIIGQKQAVVSSSDYADESLDLLAERVTDMAKFSTEDPFIAVAEKEQYATKFIDLEQYEGIEPSSEWLLENAKKCEEAAFSFKEITNSEGASTGYYEAESIFVTSKGFVGELKSSGVSMSASVIAGSDDNMQSDYDYHSTTFLNDLKSAEEIGKAAAKRTIAKLNPRKINSCKLPIMFEPRIAREFLDIYVSATNGAAIARGTSFLKDKLGKQIFKSDINIIDDPLIIRGKRSRNYDGEGLQCYKQSLVEGGVLKDWVLDLSSAKKLGMKYNAHASRGGGIPSPSASNLYFQKGKITPENMMKQIGTGIYVTELMGNGENLINGDYSIGVSGFYIENGIISYPVSEITIAGNLNEMFMNLSVADDLEFLYGFNSPTLLIENMTVAGT